MNFLVQIWDCVGTDSSRPLGETVRIGGRGRDESVPTQSQIRAITGKIFGVKPQIEEAEGAMTEAREPAQQSLYTYISVDYSHQSKVAIVTMRRPEVHNALNAQLIEELMVAFTDLSEDEQLHAVVLTGDARSFSAGADLRDMQAAKEFTEEENLNDALRLADLLYTINSFPCAVVGRINGTAMGGGVGLVSVCDIVIAAENARFAFSEAKLGIAPAVISPYVVRKIGETNARVLFLTGERFSAVRGREIGLVHAVVPPEHLDDAVQKALNELLTSGPQAIRACKTLALSVGTMDYQSVRHYTAEAIAHLRVSSEGQEGLRAFLEKRKPNWILSSTDGN